MSANAEIAARRGCVLLLALCAAQCNACERALATDPNITEIAPVWSVALPSQGGGLASPLVVGSEVFTISFRTLVAVRATDGAIRVTSASAGAPFIRGGRGLAASDTVLFAGDYDVAAFRQANLVEMWRLTPPAVVQFSNVVTNGARIFWGDCTGTIGAADAATGTIAWTRALAPVCSFGCITLGLRILGDTLVAVLDKRTTAGTGTSATLLVAIAAATGDTLWTSQSAGTSSSSPRGPPAVWGPLLIYGDLHRGEIAAVDRTSHTEAWRARTGALMAGPYWSPVVDGDVVYVGDGTGAVNAVNAATGGVMWRTVVAPGGTVLSVVACGTRIFAQHGAMSVLDRNGRLVGRIRRDDMHSHLSTDGAPAYVNSSTTLYAFSCTG